MNMLEFCDRFNLSLRKAKQMRAAGVLRLSDDMPEMVQDAFAWLAKGQSLTVKQLCYFIDHPDELSGLGRYREKADSQIVALGDYANEIAPIDIAAIIGEAARGEPEAVEALCAWMQSVIPSDPVEHSYIAIRLCLGLPEAIRKHEFRRVPRAFMHVRRLPEFADWFFIEQRTNRNFTLYQKPSGFDL